MKKIDRICERHESTQTQAARILFELAHQPPAEAATGARRVHGQASHLAQLGGENLQRGAGDDGAVVRDHSELAQRGV